MLRVVGVIVVLVIYVYGLVDVIRTDGRSTRGLSKPAWLVVVVFLPVLGAILWFIFGRPYAARKAPKTLSHPTAPDDDPEFLRNLEARRRNKAEAERLKKLKDELDAKERKLKGETGVEGSDGITS
ncbi:PLDc N-terminal domain-containing protein [Arthrobacter sp. CJ23]|uniref:PLDc N-terminal domain-containing protein n=1 Tax=Arthrobacter sp. CJ23 TaxID=2972479 RepID=UPI00215BFB37|nr:PLDc N-terminal domain-containing protein [Arthrobacter sp. CJ23]UVJ38802.1 PLDc N-terminal domain-containing protein [Arthrobacter sp. CJ23]